MNTPTGLKAYLLCRYAGESNLYNSWLPSLPIETKIIDDNPADFAPPADCGILITHEHYRWEECSALRKVYEQRRIPVLILADGILEYRNTWQNPTIPDASMYQPLMADKIACIGHNSARMIESWGNEGKTEIVGLPRLDDLVDHDRLSKYENPGSNSLAFRLLVATANTPAFTPEQQNIVIGSIKSIKTYLESNPTIGNRKLEVEWRINDELQKQCEISQVENPPPLLKAIQTCDAVVTTPSTIFLEATVLGKPTAVLDFSNSPQFIPSAWTITANEHIQSVIHELAAPPAAKMLFQKCTLRDSLQISEPAIPRLVALITRMVEVAAKQRGEQKPISMPKQILAEPTFSSESGSPLRTSQFYSNELFLIDEPRRMQLELSQAVHRLGTLPSELNDKNIQISQLQAALDESRRRVADVRARLFKLRKILGIGKENQQEDIPDKTSSE